MRFSFRPSVLLACVTLVAGCTSSGPQQAMGGDFPSSISGGSGSSVPTASWVVLGETDWVIAPIGVPDVAVTGYSLGKLSSAADSLEMLPTNFGFMGVGSGRWINFAVFNRKTGVGTLAVSQRLIVWQAVRDVRQPNGLLLVASDADTNADGKINDMDATAVYQFQLDTLALTRLTPPKSTVVRAAIDKPDDEGGGGGGGGLYGTTQPVDPVNAIFVTVRSDRNGDGKHERDEPMQTIRITATLKEPPQSVLSDQQWDKAFEVWRNK